MSDTVFWRLVWKEYRVQRGFWISMAGLALLGQLLIPSFLPFENIDHPWGLFGVALIAAAFYALGCGAMLFAFEREEGTLDRLRALGPSPWAVLLSKLVFGAAATLGLLALLWMVATTVAGGRMPQGEALRVLGSVWGVALVEALAWGTLFSLVCRRVIRAAVLAAVAWMLSVLLLDLYFNTAGRMLFEQGVAAPVAVRLTVAACVLVLAAGIAWGWGGGPNWKIVLAAAFVLAGTAAVKKGRDLAAARVVFWRLVWKEYRVQRGFWIGIAAFTFLGQLIALNLPVPDFDHLARVYGIALVMPVFYALGCGAMLFAFEREEGTVDRLRFMAASQGQVLLSKMTFAGFSTVGLVVLLLLAALALAGGQLPAPETRSLLLPLWSTGLVEALAWGTLFSLVCRKVIHAVMIAAAVWVGTLICLDWVYTTPATMIFEEGVVAPVPIRLAVAGAVLLLVVAISRRWDRPQFWSLLFPVGIGADRAAPLDHATLEVARAPRLRRLLWQEWRQAWKTVAVLSLPIYSVFGVVVALLAVDALRDLEPGGFFIGLLVLSTLLGSRVFSAEQEGFRFRFLSHRGFSPSLVWFSKHLVWLLACFVTSWILCGWLFVGLAPSSPLRAAAAQWFFILPPLNYCLGQLVSMLTRRGLYALVVSLVLAAVFDGWVFLMYGLGVSFLLSVVPILFVLLFATWVHTSDWLLERKTWVARLRLAATLGVPAIALLSGVVAYRVYEIPAVKLGFSPAEYLRPITADETATAELYRKAIAALVPMELPKNADGVTQNPTYAQDGWETAENFEKDWLAANREALRLTLIAAGREECVFQDPATRELYTAATELSEIRRLSFLLLLDARRLESEGKLDDAKERYLSVVRMTHHVAARGDWTQFYLAQAIQNQVEERMTRWAGHPGQTTASVAQAISRLQELAAAEPPITDMVKTEFVALRRYFAEENPISIHSEFVERNEAVFGRLLSLVPWERIRVQRLITLLGARWYDRFLQIEQLLANGGSYRDFTAGRGRSDFYDEGTATRAWLDTTLQVSAMLPALDFIEKIQTDRTTARNAALLRMALIDYRREHGELPDSLEALLGTYFQQLPLDPYSGKSFEYRPEGPRAPLEFSRPNNFVAVPGEPLLWSIGLADAISALRPGGGTVTKGYWAFPIPVNADEGTKDSP